MVTSKQIQEITDAHPTRFWRRLNDNRIECTLCPRFCKMREGQRGLCFVRGVKDGALVLTSFGRSSGFCIDPIEKKPLNHFLPGSPVLSFGTAGCNLTCAFCQNHETSKARAMDAMQVHAMPADIARTARKAGIRSVAYTYNDPVIFHEYAIETAKECRSLGIKNVAVSAGYVCDEPRAEFYDVVDAANIDLKAFSSKFYRKLTSSALEPVLETLKHIHHASKCWLEITTLLIPGENDSDEEISQLSHWIASELAEWVPLHFSAFHPDFRMMNHGHTPPETLFRARRIAMEVGLRHVYVGNINHKSAQSSYCAECGELVIGRDRYELSEWCLDNGGHCQSCGASFRGVIEAQPGNWGRQRQMINIETGW